MPVGIILTSVSNLLFSLGSDNRPRPLDVVP